MHIYDTDNGGVDGLVRGLCDYPAQNYDHFFTKQISRSLFTEHPPHGPGMDLLSLNIQRGRDHGLACKISVTFYIYIYTNSKLFLDQFTIDQ